ncbi:unnamed protein product [Closterium sp. NIES-54]
MLLRPTSPYPSFQNLPDMFEQPLAASLFLLCFPCWSHTAHALALYVPLALHLILLRVVVASSFQSGSESSSALLHDLPCASPDQPPASLSSQVNAHSDAALALLAADLLLLLLNRSVNTFPCPCIVLLCHAFPPTRDVLAGAALCHLAFLHASPDPTADIRSSPCVVCAFSFPAFFAFFPRFSTTDPRFLILLVNPLPPFFPHSGGFVIAGVAAPSSAPRIGGFVVAGVAAPSSAPRIGGFFVAGVAAPSSAPRSGGFVIAGVAAPSAALRIGGFFVAGVAAVSAFAWGVMGAQNRYTNKPFYPSGLVTGILTATPSSAPRSGGSFLVSDAASSATLNKRGFFPFLLIIKLACRIHLHVAIATPFVHSVQAFCQVPRIAGGGSPPRLRSYAKILPASLSSHVRSCHRIRAIRCPSWRAHRRPSALP